MKLSEARSNIKPLAVTFDSGAVLNITYRPPEYTPYDLAALLDKTNPDPTKIIGMVTKIVESWDLEYDDDAKDSTDKPLTGVIPLTQDGIGENVGVTILRTIMDAVNKDQMPGEARETSDAG